MNNPQVLVTGGAGYIGSHMVNLLLENNYSVVVIDNLSTGFLGAIEQLKAKFPNADLKFYQADLLDLDSLRKVFETEKNLAGVFHFAAKCLVSESMQKPEEYFRNNVQGTVNLLAVMKEFSINKFVFSSTCAVYGHGPNSAINENFSTNPTSPYGESKLMAEKVTKWFHQTAQIKSVIFRYFNVCGAEENGLIGDSKKPSVLLVQNLIRGLMGIEEFFITCPEVDTADGTPIRDYIDVNDLCAAHLKGWEYLEKGEFGIFNLGNGKGFSVKEMITKVEEIFGQKIQVNYQSDKVRAGESARVLADTNLAQTTLHWQPNKSLSDSIQALKKWYTNFPNGY